MKTSRTPSERFMYVQLMSIVQGVHTSRTRKEGLDIFIFYDVTGLKMKLIFLVSWRKKLLKGVITKKGVHMRRFEERSSYETLWHHLHNFKNVNKHMECYF